MMKKTMKKVVSIMLLLVMVLSMFAGCGEKGQKEVTVAVAVGVYDEQKMKVKSYFEDYLAKELNVKFIFSEEGSSVEQVLSFVENAYSTGASAVLDLALASASDIEPVASKCNELGMYFVSYYGGSEMFMEKYEYGLGSADSDASKLKQQFNDIVTNVLCNQDKVYNMVLCTVAARYGNVQQFNGALGALESYNNKYNLGLSDKEMTDYCMSASTTEVATNRDDVKITIFPLFTGDALSEILKKGEYEAVVVTGNIYLRLESAIKDAETAIKKDIKLITLTEVGSSTQNSFATKDSFGNPSLDAAMLSSSSRAGIMLAMALNGVYGDKDAVLENGKPIAYNIPMWSCSSVEEYDLINKIDTNVDTYIFNSDEIKKMIKLYNDDMSPQFLQDYISKNSTLESVISRKNIK